MNELRWALPLSLLAALPLSACDTLRARAKAQDGAEMYRNGDIKKAAELFEEAAKIDPTVPPIQIDRGFTNLSLYQLSPRSKEGQEAASRAIDAFKIYMKMPVKPEQKQKARDYLIETLAQAQKYDEAVEFFRPQLEKKPPDLEALTILGNIARNMGRMGDAKKWLEKRLEVNPNDADVYLALADMDFQELCMDSGCRSTDPNKPPPSMAPALRLEKANHGLTLLKKAMEIAPNNPNLLVFANLLLIQRTYAYVPEVDPNLRGPPARLKLALDEAKAKVDEKKRADLEEAAKLRQKAMDMMKAAGAAGKDAKEAKPGATPEKK